MYGFSLLPALFGKGLTLAGVAGAVLFVQWERKTASPLMNMNLFIQNATFTFSNLAALIHYSATFAVTFLLSLYLQYIKGFFPPACRPDPCFTARGHGDFFSFGRPAF